MVVIALILILVGAGIAVSAVLENSESTTLELFGTNIDASGTAVFLLGAASMLAVLLGTWLLQVSLARSRRRHKEVKNLKKEHNDVSALEADRNRLEHEKASLEAQLSRNQGERAHGTGSTTKHPGSGDTTTDGRSRVDLTEAERRDRRDR